MCTCGLWTLAVVTCRKMATAPSTTSTSSSSSIDYSFRVDDDDHCETPIEAYRAISVFLESLAAEQCKTKETLRIYDPYFCEGNVKCRLGELGFSSVYNENEDFYQTWENNTIPEYDCIVTNPPYSSDHMEKLIRFCVSSVKPWFLLLPNYVYTKEYYVNNVICNERLSSMVFYIASTERYKYTTPKGRRQKKSGKYTSPFPTFWYCSIYRYTDKIVGMCRTSLFEKTICVTDIRQLPFEVIPDQDERKKRLKNSLKRNKNKQRKKDKKNQSQGH